MTMNYIRNDDYYTAQYARDQVNNRYIGFPTVDKYNMFASVLFIVPPRSKIRRSFIRIVDNSIFEAVIVILIILNTILVAVDGDWKEEQRPQMASDIMFYCDLFLTSCFLGECILKIMAKGFILHRDAYLHQGWNILDFFVVVSSIITSLINLQNAKPLRLIRVLRPLRSLSAVKSLKSLITAILMSLRSLVDVILLLVFLLIICSCLGVQLLAGDYHKQCYYRSFGDAQPYKIQNYSLACGQVGCGEAGIIESNLTVSCEIHLDIFKAEYFNFDNLYNAALTSFNVMTTDDWPDKMVNAARSNGVETSTFFFAMVVLGAYVCNNLIIAILTKSCQASEKENQEEKEHPYSLCAMMAMRRVNVCAQLYECCNYNDPWIAGVNHYMFSPEDDDDEYSGSFESHPMKKPSNKIRLIAFTIVENKVWGWFILVVTLANTCLLCAEHYGMSETQDRIGNYVSTICTAVYMLEFLLKIIAFSYNYFKHVENWLDFFLVVSSIPGLVTGSSDGALSALRAVRLLRILRLARQVQFVKRLLTAVLRSLSATANALALLVLFVFIYAILGVNFFDMVGHDLLVGQRFSGVWEGILSVFTVVLGDSWGLTMTEYVRRTNSFYIMYFVSCYFLGNFMFLSLFTAILIETFGKAAALEKMKARAKELREREEKEKERRLKAEALARFEQDIEQGFQDDDFEDFQLTAPNVDNTVAPAVVRRLSVHQTLESVSQDRRSSSDRRQSVSRSDKSPMKEHIFSYDDFVNAQASIPVPSLYRPRVPRDFVSRAHDEKDLDLIDAEDDYMGDLDHRDRMKRILKGSSFGLFSKVNPIRRACAYFVTWRVWMWVKVLLIVSNATMLAMDSPNVQAAGPSTLTKLLDITDVCFASVFLIETIVRLIARGVYHESDLAYFKDKSNYLDFFVAIIAWVAIFVPATGFLRGLRSLMLVKVSRGLRAVVSALLAAVPAVLNVGVLVLFLWIIWGCMGVQFMNGDLYACNDHHIGERKLCVGVFEMERGTDIDGYPITQPVPRVWASNTQQSFDNLGDAFMSLFVLSVGDGWAVYMYQAMDSRQDDFGPKSRARPFLGAFYLSFMFLGNIFAMNLITGALIDKFSEMKLEQDGYALLTTAQRKYIKVSKIMSRTMLEYPIKIEGSFVIRIARRIATNKWFDRVSDAIIVLNMLLLCVQHYQQPKTMDQVTEILNWILLGYQTAEILIKLIAYGLRFFRDIWNTLDFIIVSLSYMAVVLQLNMQATRSIRVMRGLRTLTLFPALQHIVLTLAYSIPSMINVMQLLFLVFFIFGVLGVTLFGAVKTLPEFQNFDSWPNSMLTLGQIITTEGWVDAATKTSQYLGTGGCTSTFKGCGTSAAWAYFIGFIIVGNWTMLNLFVSIILENFEDAYSAVAHRDEFSCFDDFRKIWVLFDIGERKQIEASKFVVLLRLVPPPLFNPYLTGKDFMAQMQGLPIPVMTGGFVRYRDVVAGILMSSFGIRLPEEELCRLGGNMPMTDRSFLIGHYYAIYRIYDRYRRWRIKAFAERNHELNVIRTVNQQMMDSMFLTTPSTMYNKEPEEEHIDANWETANETAAESPDEIVRKTIVRIVPQERQRTPSIPTAVLEPLDYDSEATTAYSRVGAITRGRERQVPVTHSDAVSAAPTVAYSDADSDLGSKRGPASAAGWHSWESKSYGDEIPLVDAEGFETDATALENERHQFFNDPAFDEEMVPMEIQREADDFEEVDPEDYYSEAPSEVRVENVTYNGIELRNHTSSQFFVPNNDDDEFEMTPILPRDDARGDPNLRSSMRNTLGSRLSRDGIRKAGSVKFSDS